MPPQFFEGPEKKVELVVHERHGSLRAHGRDRWAEVVAAANAQILSERSTDVLDAYLLSESSLFVFDDHATMITCGRTTLVQAVAEILGAIDPADVALLIYERKNEHYPTEQVTSFYDDASVLAQLIPGSACRFGYSHEHHIELFYSESDYEPDPNDTTLEILMHGLPESLAAQFSAHNGRPEIAGQLAVDPALSEFDVDDYMFEPAGYSLNALRGDRYYTIHVTPESEGSYVSFETNVNHRADTGSLVRRVIDLFRPESFDVLAFAPGREYADLEIPGYTVRKHVDQAVCGYGVSFMHFYRPPTGPSAAAPIRLRER